jgi:16S rRNA C1402 (ribose-2'-O) methylase RsmI
MPCISDPGWKMVRKIRETHPEIPIEVIGGPSSVSLITLLASMSAQPGSNSLSGRFEGFAPEVISQMTEKSVEIEEAKKKEFSIHFLNSKKLRNKVIDLEKNYGSEQKIFLANELTKLYERKYHGNLGELNNLMSQENNEF